MFYAEVVKNLDKDAWLQSVFSSKVGICKIVKTVFLSYKFVQNFALTIQNYLNLSKILSLTNFSQKLL